MTDTAEPITGDTGSRIISALESTWREIQQRHPEVPDVVMITGAAAQRGGDAWGYHWAGRWAHAEAEGRTAELFIAGETLAQGPRWVLCVLLHEGTHALATARGIKDTSDAGRYHNRKFAELASELGLTPPAKPAKRIGLSGVTLGDETAATYADVIDELEAGIVAYRADPLAALADEEDGEADDETTTGEKRGGQRPPAECGCEPQPRRLRLTRKQLDDGPVICGICKANFEFADEDQEEEGTQS